MSTTPKPARPQTHQEENIEGSVTTVSDSSTVSEGSGVRVLDTDVDIVSSSDGSAVGVADPASEKVFVGDGVGFKVTDGLSVDDGSDDGSDDGADDIDVDVDGDDDDDGDGDDDADADADNVDDSVVVEETVPDSGGGMI